MSTRRNRTGRDMSQLLADVGHHLPTTATPDSPPKQGRLFRYTPARGARRPGRGWAPAAAPVATYRMTSDQAPVFWPFIAGPGLPPTGAQMGVDVLSGAGFYADPIGWVLRDDIPVTNPNVICMGKPGTGKSATAKAFCLRMSDFGYRILILGDPKDEYERLCHFFGVQPFKLGPGPADADQPARVRATGARLGTVGRPGGPGPGRGRVLPLAHPGAGPGGQPTHRRRNGCRSGRRRRSSSRPRCGT